MLSCSCLSFAPKLVLSVCRPVYYISLDLRNIVRIVVVPVRSGLPPTRKRTCSTTPDEDWYSIVPPGKGSCSACEDPFNNPDEAWYRPVHTKDIRATVTVDRDMIQMFVAQYAKPSIVEEVNPLWFRRT